MTRTTEHEYHEDRPIVHFGNPGVKFWKEPKKVTYVDRDSKRGKRK